MNERRNLILRTLLYIFAAIAVSAIFCCLLVMYVLPFMDQLSLRKYADIIGVLLGAFASYKLLKSIIRMRKKIQGRK